MPRRDERGAVVPLVAILLTVLVGITALTVDIGQQRVARADMQALADVVALDLARELDGREAQEIAGGLQSAADLSRDRNGDTAGADAVVAPELGTLVDGQFAAVSGTAVPDAVMVTATTTVDFSFRPGTGGAGRTSIATAEATACFRLGSYAAAMRSGDASLLAPLNGLLGVDLTAASYQGLLGADLTLDQLVATGELGDVDQLLTGSVSLGTFYAAVLSALGNEGGNSAAVSALGDLVSAHVNQAQPVSVGDVVHVAPGDTAALGVALNVLDLLTGAALVADGDNAVAVPTLSAGTGTVGVVTSTLEVVQRAQLACGRVGAAEAANSQVSGTLRIPLTLPAVAGFTATTTGVVANVDVGNAVGTLAEPQPVCAAGTAAAPDTLNVALATSLLTLSVVAPLHLRQVVSVPVTLGSISVVVAFDVSLSSSVPMTAATGTAPLTVPPNDVTPYSGGSDTRLAGFATTTPVRSNLTVTLADGSAIPAALLATVNAVVNPLVDAALAGVSTTIVSGVLNPLVSSVNTLMLGPLATLLGLDVAGADVYAVGRPVCNTPQLAG